ncbi:MAG: M20/M25/M40 family metallo-hydrolase [Bacteroidales bacterium]|nr:M20/M25/M40 family metallo-hydrolase [Bacteroidales bacterium]
MKKSITLAGLLLLTINYISSAQESPKDKGLQAITMESIKGQLEFLASDWTEGRSTGEKGEFLATAYAASIFRIFGAAPAGDAAMGEGSRFMGAGGGGGTRPAPQKSYFQNFTLIESQPGGSSQMSVTKAGREYIFEENVDFSVARVTLGGRFEAPVVFVGYGIADKEKGIDDFAGIDMKGKIAIRLPGYPGIKDNSSPMYKKLVGDNPRAAFDIQRKKNETLASLGAAGVIDLSIGTDAGRRWGTMRLDGKEVPNSPVNLTITERVANLILKDSGIDIEKYEKEAAAGTSKFKPVIIPATSASVTTNVKSRRVNVRNVVAMIEGEIPNEYVAVGAHIDHMGIDNGKIWNGADDNASGTVAVLTLAKAFAASGIKPKRTILFCAWTGEEKGLLGSEYFTLYPPAGKISEYKFYMNFDMIARDVASDSEKNMAGITYTKAFPGLEENTKKAVEQYKLNLKLNIRSAESPTGGSDYTAFSENKIPVIAWMAAMHPDYHQPTDHISLVNWDKMLNIIKLGYLQLWEAANGDIK